MTRGPLSFSFDLRFPGQTYFAETGFNYNYYRDGYDPTTGRYTQSDPVGLYGGLNTYAYGENSPIRNADPKGLSPAAAAVIDVCPLQNDSVSTEQRSPGRGCSRHSAESGRSRANARVETNDERPA